MGPTTTTGRRGACRVMLGRRGRLAARLGLIGLVGVSVLMLAPLATAHEFGCDAVDDGEIRYEDFTQYDDALAHAVAAWHVLGNVDILPDTWWTAVDLQWLDTYRTDVVWDGLFLCGPIAPQFAYLNDAYFETYGWRKKRAVATHELGHGLGLGHSYSPQIMYRCASCGGFTTPQSHDREDYYKLWP